MIKKYLPFIIILAAAFLLWYVKSHQRGKLPDRPKTDYTIDPVLPKPAEDPVTSEELNRKAGKLTYSKHARCRMDCRHIDESEVKEILETGTINYSKIESDARGKTYPLEGVTHDKQHVRIVFAPKKDAMVVVTVIDLDSEWKCACN